MSFLIILILSAVLFFTLESLIYDNIKDPYLIIKNNFTYFMYNIIIIFTALSIFINIFSGVTISYILISLLIIFAGIFNYQMLYYRNELIKPTDLMLGRESLDISEHLEIKFPSNTIYIILLNIIVSIITYMLFIKIPSIYISQKILIPLMLFITVIVIGTSYNGSRFLKVKRNSYDDFSDYKNNGYLLTFLCDIMMFFQSPPVGYNKTISKNILESTDTCIPDKRPNIIIIMNESFFDINSVPFLRLSKNPLENFDALRQKYTNGNVSSPVIGGGTCQPEYEMLTGNSVFFTGKFKISFMSFLKEKKVSGICSVLKNLNYFSLFIHPYKIDFYNRVNVYQSLGFDKILDIKCFENVFKPRKFISDIDCYKKVIENFEIYKNSDKTVPFFANVVTMQNHPGYLQGTSYNEHNIEVLNKNISSDEKIMLENYANLLCESDRAFSYLTDYFSDKEDTVIMMFGDHQPSENIGFSKICNRTSIELSKTPFIIWDNMGLEKEEYELINPCFLTPILFDKIGNKSDAYFNYLFNLMDTVSAFNTDFVYAKNELYNRKDISLEVNSAIKELSFVQYYRKNDLS